MTLAIWRRLDVPGHDVAHVAETETGWRLEGVAVFKHERGPARVSYWVECATDWSTRRAGVAAWIGAQRCDLDIERTANGQWKLNGETLKGLDGCVDVDFGFTPATNFLQLRRCNLQVGRRAQFNVAWIDVPEGSLTSLLQRYERRTASSYWYESPQGPYEATLEMSDSGFVRVYPTLWEMED
jgi:uncharacterized protein